MSQFLLVSKKFLLMAVIAVLVFTALPITPASAAGLQDDPQPGDGGRAHPRLRIAFQRLQRRYERQDSLLERTDGLIEKAQGLIDKATEKGLDALSVQAALDALVAVLPDVRTAHEQAGAIVTAHNGFDDNGKVTDPAAAAATIEDLRTALQDTRQAMNGTAKALLQAVRDFIEENRDAIRPEGTPQP